MDPTRKPGFGGEVSTRQLLEELDRGDPIAAKELVDRYHPELTRHAFRHPWMQALAGQCSVEDVVQETFSRALSSGLLSARQERVPGALRRALLVVLERALADQLRRSGALKRGANAKLHSIDLQASEDAGGSVFAKLTSSSTTPTVSARYAELIRLCQQQLEDREWEVWRLRAVAGLDFLEIAELTGSSESAVRGVAHRARHKLILALARLDPELDARRA